MLLFKLHHKDNPFVKKSRRLSNGTMFFITDAKVHHSHIL